MQCHVSHIFNHVPHPILLLLIIKQNKMASVLTKKAMWQRYIDDALLLTEQVTMASIHGLDGNRWASTEDFEVRS